MLWLCYRAGWVWRKSLIYQLLPYLFETEDSNIVIVVSPLNSIIEDQIKILVERGISVSVLPITGKTERAHIKLFTEDSELIKTEKEPFSSCITGGDISILFAHPEALLGKNGQTLLKSSVYQRRVVACVIDEVHCVEKW